MSFKPNYKTFIYIPALTFLTYKVAAASSSYAGWLLPIIPTVLNINPVVGSYFTATWMAAAFVSGQFASTNNTQAPIGAFITNGTYSTLYAITGLCSYGIINNLCNSIPLLNHSPTLSTITSLGAALLVCTVYDKAFNDHIRHRLVKVPSIIDKAFEYILNMPEYICKSVGIDIT